MLLPGGLWDGKERRQEYAFLPITGEFELALIEAGTGKASLARVVTRVLATSLAHLGHLPASAELVERLAVGDRQFLIRSLAAELDRDLLWIVATCAVCQHRFDVQIEQARLPVKEAGPTFPFATAQLSWGECRLRVPTGGDQEAAVEIEADQDAVRVLAWRCIADEPRPPIQELRDADVVLIEQAVEAAAPEVSTIAQAACPSCRQMNEIYVDPYASLCAESDGLWDDIHEMASCYHWSEGEILGLPRERRQTYLRHIARTRALAHQGAASEWDH